MVVIHWNNMMATYAIGDIHGCYMELLHLLEKIAFDSRNDTLWFAGDMVNRGPQSLDVLRFIKALGNQHIAILGNHDLHLLALYYNQQTAHRSDTLDSILSAPDSEALITWLRQRPLLHYPRRLCMVHAGIPPQWTLTQAQQYAAEVEALLRGDPIATLTPFLAHMYGNEPQQWHEQLTGNARLRCITNYLTRMRYCSPGGRLDLTIKTRCHHLLPWFQLPNRATANLNILFGHWASLGIDYATDTLFPLDAGCVWGNQLAALRLEDQHYFSVPSQQPRKH